MGIRGISAAAMVMLFILICAPAAAEDTSPERTSYDLSIFIDVEEHSMSVNSHIIYYNIGDVALDDIRMALHPAAYSSLDTVPLITSVDTAYPNGFSPGDITITDSSLPYEIIDDTVLVLTLEESIAPGESVEFELSYFVEIPETQNRMGHFDDVIALGNTFPYIGVVEGGAWKIYPYYSRGDPFYSEISDWHVTVTVESGWVVGTTGTITLSEEDGTITIHHIEAEGVRDFALACSPRYGVYEVAWGDTTIRSLYLPGYEQGGRSAAMIASRALDLFGDMLGEYPYETLTIASTYLGGAAGMEYPQIVFIDAPYYDASLGEFFETVVVHEIAHQWWYAVVGNDEVADPFIDESLAQFMTLLYYDEHYSSTGYEQFKSYLYTTYDGARERIVDDIPAQNLLEYATDNEYILMTYYKGPLVLDTMRWSLGEEAFRSFLKNVYETYQYKTLTTHGLIDELYAYGFSTEACDAFKAAIVTDTLPDVAAGTANWDGTTLELSPVIPAGISCEVSLMFEDGTTLVSTWPNPKWPALDAPPTSYVMDPHDRLLESNEDNNSGIVTYEGEENGGATAVYIGVALCAVLVAAAILAKRKR